MSTEVKAVEYSKKSVGKLRRNSKEKHTWVAYIDHYSVQVEFFDSKKSGKVRVNLNARTIDDSKRSSKDSYRFSFAYGDHEIVILQEKQQTNLFINGFEFEHYYKEHKVEEIPARPEAPGRACRLNQSEEPEQEQFSEQNDHMFNPLVEIPNRAHHRSETTHQRTHSIGAQYDPFLSHQTPMIQPNDKKLIIQAALHREYSQQVASTPSSRHSQPFQTHNFRNF